MKDTKELRAFLLEQMNGVATGKTNLEQAKAVSNLAQQIYNTITVEIRVATARAKLSESEINAVSFE